MPLVITFTFVPFAIIYASRFNTNFTDVSTWANAHEIATTGVHGVGAGTIVGTALVQTLSNKTFSDNLVFSSGTAFTGTFDHANTVNRIWTLPDKAGEVVIAGTGVPAIFVDNVDVYNGFDFRAFSDAGVTQKAGIDGATGAIFGLSTLAIGKSSVTAGVTVDIEGTIVGSPVYQRIYNADGTNVGSDSGFIASTNNSGAGDPFFMWDVNGVQAYWSAILNQTDDDWAFGLGNVIGTTPKLYYDRSADRWGMFTTTPVTDFDLTKTTVGGYVTFTVRNLDNTNAASHAAFSVESGGNAAGDAMYLLGISGITTWSIGVDRSDGNTLKIGNNLNVGTDTALHIISSSSVGVNPAQTSATDPTLWTTTTDYGFSESGGGFFCHNQGGGAWYFRNNASVDAFINNNGSFNTLCTDSSLTSVSTAKVTINNVNGAVARATAAGALTNKFNVASITYNAGTPGRYVYNLTTAVTTDVYPQALPRTNNVTNVMSAIVETTSATTAEIYILDDGGAPIDSASEFMSATC